MTTIEDRAVVEQTRADSDQRQADWAALVASLSDVTSEAFGVCALCGRLAIYEGQGCADNRVVKLCKSCVDSAIYRLSRMRDDAKLATGCEPVCNRCWRPILDPATHIDLRPLWG
jgi:hypothetical protein